MKRLKVAIVLDVMSMGGIPKACVPLVKELLYDCDVTLIMTNDKGELQHLLPQETHIVVQNGGGIKSALRSIAEKKGILAWFPFLIKYMLYTRIQKRWVAALELLAQCKDTISNECFDCVIAFHGMSMPQLVRSLYQVQARKKIAWIHGDHPFHGKHISDADLVYQKFDRIYCDSGICALNFIRDFPDAANIVRIGHPLIEIEKIRKQAEEPSDFYFEQDCINILTVGRLSPEKGQDLIPDTILELRKTGRKFAWYLVGDGDDRPRIEALAREKKCTELHFLGTKVNPYPYMRQCDIYVQPSYSEAYSITAFEAATLGKVSVLTDVAGATEILKDGYNTIVVQPDSISIAEGIKILLNNPKQLKSMSERLLTQDFSNKQEVKDIVDWIRE